ncbi:hypothetical protein Lal_00022836 [Lupinus albus]|nr:hypothetical protein Lal_00022836 [Lupinus albus]
MCTTGRVHDTRPHPLRIFWRVPTGRLAKQACDVYTSISRVVPYSVLISYRAFRFVSSTDIPYKYFREEDRLLCRLNPAYLGWEE